MMVSNRVWPRLRRRSSRRGNGAAACLAAGLLGAMPLAMAGQNSAAETVRPARLVIVAARDTTAGFVALPLAASGRRALVWPEGVVVVPDSIPWLEAGQQGLAIPLSAPLEGAGAGGSLPLAAGRYDLDTPLYLGSGEVTAYLTGGVLEVAADELRYRRARPARDPRADYLLLAGLVLATGVLLHQARRRRSRRT